MGGERENAQKPRAGELMEDVCAREIKLNIRRRKQDWSLRAQVQTK